MVVVHGGLSFELSPEGLIYAWFQAQKDSKSSLQERNRGGKRKLCLWWCCCSNLICRHVMVKHQPKLHLQMD